MSVCQLISWNDSNRCGVDISFSSKLFIPIKRLRRGCWIPRLGLLGTAASHLHGEVQQGTLVGITDEHGDPITCEVVAIDHPLDIAVLKASQSIPRPAMPYIADQQHINEHVALGDPVWVIGRHGDQQVTATQGLLSAVDRRLRQSLYPLAQTDARINYGSLGGVVMNAHGQAIGMVVHAGPHLPWMINSGVGMVVTTDALAAVLPALQQGETREEPMIIGLGVRLDELRITAIIPETGAAAAGLAVGDVLQAIDGRRLLSLTDVSRLLIRRSLGDVVCRVCVVVSLCVVCPSCRVSTI